MNQNSISRYESGAREADYKALIAFADYFHVSIDYLLERTDNPTFLPVERKPACLKGGGCALDGLTCPFAGGAEKAAEKILACCL